jgi:phage FluMu protein Com
MLYVLTREFRCIDCNKLLFKWYSGSFVIEVICPRCGWNNKISWIKQESHRAPLETGFFNGTKQAADKSSPQ